MNIVTGMHRSGTSLVCQLLREAGADFGDKTQFFPTDQWNNRGYLELKPVIDLNSALITGVPRTKSRVHSAVSQCLYIAMPRQAHIDRRTRRYAAQIEELANRFADLTVKDPRFCLTLPAWLPYSRVERIVVCVRHPHKVARSLMKRQQLPYRLACRFWSYHVRSLLKHLPREKTIFFNVDDFTAGEGPGELDRLLRFLDMGAAESRRHQIVNKVLRRNMMGTSHAVEEDLPAETRRLWTELKTTAESGNERST